MVNYYAYIRSTAWVAKRIQFLNSDTALSKCCYFCKKPHEQGFHVHHLTYHRLGNELMSDLMLLCPKHHKAVHDEQARMKQRMPQVNLLTATRRAKTKYDMGGLKHRLNKQGIKGVKRIKILKAMRKQSRKRTKHLDELRKRNNYWRYKNSIT